MPSETPVSDMVRRPCVGKKCSVVVGSDAGKLVLCGKPSWFAYYFDEGDKKPRFYQCIECYEANQEREARDAK